MCELKEGFGEAVVTDRETRSNNLSMRHVCSKCKKFFNTYAKLRTHQIKTANCTKTKGKFHCEFCGQGLSSAIRQAEHEKIRKCSKCGAPFDCYTLLSAHKELCTPASRTVVAPIEEPKIASTTFVCEFCNRYFTSAKSHYSRLSCRWCKRADKCTVLHAAHSKICKFRKPKQKCRARNADIKCRKCNKRFKSRAALRKHFRHRQCVKCHAVTFCFESFKSHVCTEQTPKVISARAPQPIHQDDVKKCQYCGESRKTDEDLECHSRPSNCPRCGYSQPCNSLLAKHLDLCRYSEELTAIKYIKCPLCRFPFAGAALLGAHVVKCKGGLGRGFQCRSCTKTCKTRAKLEAHEMRRHSAPRISSGSDSDADVGNTREHQANRYGESSCVKIEKVEDIDDGGF